MVKPNKKELFISNLMGDKSVDEVHGIGSNYSERFKDRLNITKAYQVLVAFLYFGKDKKQFCDWFKGIVLGDNSEINSERCCIGLEEWCKNHLSHLGTIPSFKPPVIVTIDDDKLLETLIDYIEKFKDSPEHFLSQVPVPSINQPCYDWIAEWVEFVKRV